MICIVNAAGGCMELRVERLDDGKCRVSEWYLNADTGKYVLDEARTCVYDTFYDAWNAIGNTVGAGSRIVPKALESTQTLVESVAATKTSSYTVTKAVQAVVEEKMGMASAEKFYELMEKDGCEPIAIWSKIYHLRANPE